MISQGKSGAGAGITDRYRIGQRQQYQVGWYSDKATTAAISIQSAPGGHMGNDFALDDIWFYKSKKPKK